MKKSMKKIIALIMAFCMALIPSGISFAQTDVNYGLSKMELKEKIQEEIYKEYSVLASHMDFIKSTLNNVTKENGWIFHITIEGLENEISLVAKNDEKISILCRQNEIENQLDIFSN